MDERSQHSIPMDSEAILENRDNSTALIESADNKSEEPCQKKSNEDVLSCELEEEANTLSTNGIDKLVASHTECGIANCESTSYIKLSQPDQNKIQIQIKSSSENLNKVLAQGSTLREQSEVESECVDSTNETNKSINLEKDFSFVHNSHVINSNIKNLDKDGSTVITKNSKEELNHEEEILKDNIHEDLKKEEEKEFNSLDLCNSQNSTLETSDKDCTMKQDVKGDFHFEEKILSPDLEDEDLKEENKQIEFQRNTENNEPNEVKSEESKEIDSCNEVKNSHDGSVATILPECISNINEKSEIVMDSLSYANTKTTHHELEKKNEELSIKVDCLSDQNNSNLSISNTSTDQSAENLSKSENDGTEIMDTEMVNCNDIELVDLNENELQKDKEIDRIGSDSSELESKGEQKTEEVLEDMLENTYNNDEEKAIDSSRDSENQKEVISFREEIHQPGNSEEETITGDTGNITATNVQNNKDKDEDVCIIPDDMTSGLSILSKKQAKYDFKKNESEKIGNSNLKVIQVGSPEQEKTKSSSNEKKLEEIDNLKSRPIRNAAKLAGNKIRSLVLNDLVFEEQGSGGNVKDEGNINVNSEESHRMCAQCREVKLWKFLMVHGDTNQYLCSEQCSEAFAKNCQTETDAPEIETGVGEFVRKCAQCHAQVIIDDRCLFWETMDFCNEDCLGKYQTKLGSNCANCKGSVFHSSLGKYCVRFGYDVKQFCSSACLEEYKKGLKVCSYCQKDISTGAEGFLAPVGDKGQFKDFCTQSCMEKYEQMSSNAPQPDIIEECAVCSNSKAVRVEVELDNKTHKLCSKPCFAAFKFVNNITEGQCDMCRKYFDRAKTENFAVFYDETPRCFCCKTCMNVYILANRKIVPCNWCKVKKYNFDMIKKGSASGQLTMMCSLNCLTLYQLSMNTVCSRRVKCDFCLSLAQTQYHLTMSDATTRNFCSYACAMSFQNQYPKQGVDIISGTEQLDSPIPTGVPRRATPRRSQVESPCVPVISSVQSLASSNDPASPPGRFSISRADVVTQVNPMSQPMTLPPTVAPMPAPPPQIYQQIITKPPPAKQMKNKSVLCKPYSHTKGVSCRPHPCVKETQTDQCLNRKFLIPIPVPIYVPAPMHMFATPFPVPVPFPLPVPVPIFIPTTRNSAKGIFKEIKKIQEKIPTDPFEAELLMMAEMVAGEKKQDPTDSESDEGNDGEDGGDGSFSPENVDASNTFGDDMLQMALKMASELEEPAVDMESVLTSNTITTSTQPSVDPNKALYASAPDNPDQVHVMSMNRGRKRSVRGSRNSTGGTPSKRGRRTSGSVDVPLLPPPEPVPPPRIEVEKPDANMCLKYTFGVNAWRHWVMQKNAELEKAAMTNRKIKLFKPELLQLTADELNFSLCLFVKEVRKPNGTEYAPDTIYYLCLGIQQYLFENGRIDNIFTDSYYEKFTDCLDEVAKKFAALYNDSQYIVTRVEEEHLWESKQLGAHSPHVLLSTLMFFNTKHFNLVTVEEHMQLSFSHIMKHWKRNPNTPGVAKVPGSRNVLLRFYPPQSALEANTRKKKVYEQQENEENPLRCPVKLYEFYLSKCPESVKTRNDVFYLLPERSCVPDSPVWYSTMALGKEPLMKMLHRVKMVKEINIALLTC